MATENENEQPSEDVAIQEDEGRVEIPAEDEVDEEEAKPEAKPSRDEKKRNRFRELQERAEAAERRAAEAAERTAKLEGAVQTLSQQRQYQPEQRQTQDPLETELHTIYDRQEALSEQIEALAAANKLTPEARDRIRREARALDIRSKEIIVERSQRAQQRQAPEQEQRARIAATAQQLQAEHAKVYAAPNGRALAQKHFYAIVAMRGEPRSEHEQLAMVKEALVEAERELGIRREPPSDAQKHKYGSVSRSAGGTGGSTEKSSVIRGLSPKMAQRMADAAYGHVNDPNVRLQMWKKGPGRKMLADEG